MTIAKNSIKNVGHNARMSHCCFVVQPINALNIRCITTVLCHRPLVVCMAAIGHPQAAICKLQNMYIYYQPNVLWSNATVLLGLESWFLPALSKNFSILMNGEATPMTSPYSIDIIKIVYSFLFGFVYLIFSSGPFWFSFPQTWFKRDKKREGERERRIY